MIALLITRCGCRKYIKMVPWDNHHEIIMPLSYEGMGLGYRLENRPEYFEHRVEERRFVYEKTEKFQGEEVAIYRERE